MLLTRFPRTWRSLCTSRGRSKLRTRILWNSKCCEKKWSSEWSWVPDSRTRVPVLCTQNAAVAKNEKTLVLASLGNTLAFPQSSAHMRRLFGPCGYASRRDVLVAQDLDTVSEEEDFEACMAYRKAKWAKTEGG